MPTRIPQFWGRLLRALCLFILLSGLISQSTAYAGINDDLYDGNIFVVYGGNGSLVPPKLTLTQTFERQIPTILVYYIDDSSDCKPFTFVANRLQEFYGRAASIIPVSVDTIPAQDQYEPTQPGYYYRGTV
ncbi:MAG: thylakoid membrane photosystem I accumulation factor, partial [Cyanobacteria bacterium P01_H01_bin.15]